MKSKIEIINEVASHFNATNRALDPNGDCAYITEDGRKCAVGMFLNNAEDFLGDSTAAEHLLLKKGFGILKEEYRIENPFFWNDLQMLHDREMYWDEKGLTQKGERQKALLIKAYTN